MDTNEFTEIVMNCALKNTDIPLLVKEIYTSTKPFCALMKIDFNAYRKNLLTNGVKKHSKVPKDRTVDIPYMVESIIDDTGDTGDTIDIKKQIEILNSMPQPQQRSPEWYEYRQNVITASSASHILESQATFNKYMEEKVLPEKHFQAGTACQFGIKFEDTACAIYEKLTNTKVNEYGCIRHSHITHIGASPDGIVTQGDDKYLGRMLEIKCLYSREMFGVPLYKYWVQCQIQLETCNLPFCDFFECKLNENLTETEFYQKIQSNTIKSFYGVIIEYTLDGTISYKYSELNANETYYKDFVDTNIDLILEKPEQDILKITYFELDKYSLVTIKRNRDWFASIKPKFTEFWKEVEKKRDLLKENPEAIISMFPKKTRKRKTSVSEICIIIEDEEDEFW
jgi:putative phage-type endonuclease